MGWPSPKKLAAFAFYAGRGIWRNLFNTKILVYLWYLKFKNFKLTIMVIFIFDIVQIVFIFVPLSSHLTCTLITSTYYFFLQMDRSVICNNQCAHQKGISTWGFQNPVDPTDVWHGILKKDLNTKSKYEQKSLITRVGSLISWLTHRQEVLSSDPASRWIIFAHSCKMTGFKLQTSGSWSDFSAKYPLPKFVANKHVVRLALYHR